MNESRPNCDESLRHEMLVSLAYTSASVLATERCEPESFILKIKAAISGSPLVGEDLPAQDVSLGCLEFYLTDVEI